MSLLYELESPPLTAESLDEEVLATMEKTLHFDKQAIAKSVRDRDLCFVVVVVVCSLPTMV